MNISKEIIEKYAAKLLIGLTEEENKMVLDEFHEIDENISLINEIDGVSEAEPMTHALDDFEYELREDIAVESTELDELLANCDEYLGREVEVPKVVGE